MFARTTYTMPLPSSGYPTTSSLGISTSLRGAEPGGTGNVWLHQVANGGCSVGESTVAVRCGFPPSDDHCGPVCAGAGGGGGSGPGADGPVNTHAAPWAVSPGADTRAVVASSESARCAAMPASGCATGSGSLLSCHQCSPLRLKTHMAPSLSGPLYAPPISAVVPFADSAKLSPKPRDTGSSAGISSSPCGFQPPSPRANAQAPPPL